VSDLTNIDWDLFRQQKECLIGVIEDSSNDRERDLLSGLLHLLDAVQDEFEPTGFAAPKVEAPKPRLAINTDLSDWVRYDSPTPPSPDDMYQAYIEAVYFTETGDLGQPSRGAELTALFKAQAHTACRNFLYGASSHARCLDAKQLGHDLWLTRNGHGTGFWDRPEVYGADRADLFTRIATAMGEHDAEFVEKGASK
jgi:hypothetical protein